MVLKRDRPPRSVQSGPDRVQAAWERQIQEKTGDSNLSLGDLENIVGLIGSQRTAIEELKRRFGELENSIALTSKNAASEEVKKQIDELETTLWLLHQN